MRRTLYYKWSVWDDVKWRAKNMWRAVRGPFWWLKRHNNREYRELVKYVRSFESWDWSYTLELERAALRCMSEYHKRTQLIEGWEDIVRRIELCIRLIDIIVSCDYDSDVYINTRNVARFVGNDDIEAWRDALTGNCNRAVKEEVRVRKAERLYHAIRARYERDWWD